MKNKKIDLTFNHSFGDIDFKQNIIFNFETEAEICVTIQNNYYFDKVTTTEKKVVNNGKIDGNIQY